jgi:hypothetical protein
MATVAEKARVVGDRKFDEQFSGMVLLAPNHFRENLGGMSEANDD